jgi:WD40 repeat protein
MLIKFIRRPALLTVFIFCALLTRATAPVAQPGASIRPIITPANAPDVTLLAATGVETIFDLDWSPDGQYLAVTSSHNVAIYDPDDLGTRRILRVDPCSPAAFSPCRASVAFSDDGQTLIAGGRDGVVDLYRLPTFARMARYRSDVFHTSLHFNQSHGLLVLAGSPVNTDIAVIRDFTTGGGLAALPADAVPKSLAFYEQEAQRGAELFNGYTSGVHLSPDGRYLAAALSTAWLPARLDYGDQARVALYDLEGLFAELDRLGPRYANYDFDVSPFRRDLPMGTAEAGGPAGVRFSPDGARLAGAGLDGQLRVWSMPDATLEATWEAHYAPAWDLAFSPDGSRLATAGGDGAVRIWDAVSGEARLVIDGLGVAATALAYSPDGARLAVGGWDGTLWIFDAATGARLDMRSASHFVGWAIAYNADGTRFALASESGAVYLYDTLAESPFIVERRVLHGPQGAVYSLAFHPDGQHLAAGGQDGMIHIWAMDTGEIARTVATVPRSPVYGLAYHPTDGALYCATLRGSGRVTQDATPSVCPLAIDSPGTIYSLAFSRDGALLAEGDTTLRDLQSGESIQLETQRGSSDSFRSPRSKLTFSADGRTLLNGGPQQPGYVWRVDALAAAPSLYDVGVMAFSPDGALVAGGQGLAIYETLGGAQLYPPEPRVPTRFDPLYADLPRDAAFSPDGRLIVALNNAGALRFWGLSVE